LRARLIFPSLLALASATSAHAAVVGVEITSRETIGSFGAIGAYERISGRFKGELDPNDPKNAIITDLKRAPRNARGRVEYSATFSLAKPLDMSKASGFLFYQTPNRGGGTADGDADGRITLISGWQGDIPPAPNMQTATVPTARNPDGSPVTGSVLVRIVDLPAGAKSVKLTGGINGGVPRPLPLSLDTTKAKLVTRTSDTAAPVAVPSSDFAFADCSQTAFPGTPDGTQLCVKGGVDHKLAYALGYTAKDPLVLGIGFAATRDITAFFKRGEDTPATPNPVAGQVKWAIGVGVSQAGNYMRSLLHLGFNQAEDGGIVFDGLNPQIAARHTPLNFRFAVPGGAATLFEPGSEGPLWWSRYNDRTRGNGTTSLLDRCNATDTCPKIFETFTSAEFWGLRMSPDLIGTDAKADIPLAANVRRYYFPSTTHGGGGGGFAIVDPAAPVRGACGRPGKPNPPREHLRGMTLALQRWVLGAEPPASVYPTLAKGDLVEAPAKATGFPTIPGKPSPDGKLNVFLAYDFGPGFTRNTLSGVMTRLPPTVARNVPSRVPRVDADGNETSGVKSVQARAPLGSYLGWNVQAAGYAAGEGCGFQGGYIPFATTRAEREAKGDPRPSLQERYGDHAGFVAAVRKAAGDMVAEGFLLRADAEAVIKQAEDSTVLR